MQYKDITLDPFQERSIEAIHRGDSLLVAAPTGAGKTLVAEYAVEKCLAEGRRAVYTAPIKALSNQKFRDFTAQYGDRIGIKTGDVTINPDAQIVLMTTEIFRNTIFESPRNLDDVSYAIFDEIHFLDDIERGTVWEESIIFAPAHIRFICLSATIPNIDPLARWIRKVRPETPLEVVLEDRRPVPLQHKIYVPGIGLRKTSELKSMEKERRRPKDRITADEEDESRRRLIDHLFEADRLPALFFCFNRKDCELFASTIHRSLVTAEQRAELLGLFDDLLDRFAIEPDADVAHLRDMVGRGAAYHHAGLMPTLKEVIERIFTSGMLKVLFATETFAVGVNMPARTVVFNTLYKWDGRRLNLLRTREHHQMSGRAGRRGIDEVGYAYSIADWPGMRVKQIEQVLWGDVEPIRSQFNLSYATILSLYDHLGDKLYEACEKSFMNFAVRRQRRQRAAKSLRDQLKRKILVLRSLDYLKGEKLTRKGRFAKTIYGYELQVSEFYFSGLLHRLNEHELNVLFCGIVYEAKKGQWFRKLDHREFAWLKKAGYRTVDDIRYVEETMDIEDRTKEMDFKLGSAVHAWSRGKTFRDLEAYTDAADGDVVRFFRLTIQLLRNTMFACDRHDTLRGTLQKAIDCLRRDVVDAERQLRMSADGLPASQEEPLPGEHDDESPEPPGDPQDENDGPVS